MKTDLSMGDGLNEPQPDGSVVTYRGISYAQAKRDLKADSLKKLKKQHLDPPEMVPFIVERRRYPKNVE